MTAWQLALRAGLAAAVPVCLAAQQATFRSSVDAVSVPVAVMKDNQPAPGLTAADFQLLDNDVLQDIALTTVDRLPVDVTLMIDTSGSVNGRALERLKADVQQMGGSLQSTDRVRLVTFARTPVEVFGLQPGGSRLPVERIDGGGVTALYDALASALVAFPYVDRPQLVFALTDGRDTSSFLDAARIVALARYSTTLLCIGLVSPTVPPISLSAKVEAVDPLAAEQSALLLPGDRKPSIVRSAGPYIGSPNVSALKAAAAATGGVVYDNPAGTAIPELFRHVLDDFRASYVLTYMPRGVSPGGWHTITVKTRKSGYTIRARKGYERQ